jgi:hypothetical protein
VQYVAIYGTSGHAQRGIDVKVRLQGGQRTLIQCR